MRIPVLVGVAGIGVFLAADRGPVAADEPSGVRVDLSYGTGGRGPAPAHRRGELIDGKGRLLRAWGSMSVPNDFDAGISRFGTDGLPDASFADNGTFRLVPPGELSSETLSDAGFAEGGAILLLSAASPPVTYSPVTLRLTRLTEDGSIDAAYGDGGTAVVATGLDTWSEARGGPMLVRPAGDALVVVVDPLRSPQVVLRRVTESGLVDGAFAGGAGDAALPLSPRISEGFAITTDAAGRILVAGVEPTADGIAEALRIVRLTPDGERDTSFGTDGVATVGAGMSARLTYPSIAIGGTDGELCVVSGNAWSGSALASAFVAVLRTDSPMTTALLREADLGTPPLSALALEAQSDGRVVVAMAESQRSVFTLRLRFDGKDGAPPPPPPPPPPLRGPVVTASWAGVDRVLNSHGVRVGRVDVVVHVANVGDQGSAARPVRVLLSRDAAAGGRDGKLADFELPALAAGASADIPLRLKVARGKRGRHLLVVPLDDPTRVLAVSEPIP